MEILVMKSKKAFQFFGGLITGTILTLMILFSDKFLGLSTWSSRKHSPWQTLQHTHLLLQESRYRNDSKRRSSQNFLPIVLASRNDSTGTFKAVNSTWGESCPDWLVAMGDIDRLDLHWLEQDYGNLEHVIVATECCDVSMDERSSHSNILCLLNAIYRTSSEDYPWFVIMPSYTYVSVHNINNLLSNYDPNVPAYIGKPTTYCAGGHWGIMFRYCVSYCDLNYPVILSQASLRDIIPHLSHCLVTYGRDNTDSIVLGICMNEVLALTCSDSLLKSWVDPAALFQSYSSHSWLQGRFVGLSHIPTYKEMLTVHVHMLSVHMWTSINNAKANVQLMYQTCSQLPGCNMSDYDQQVMVFHGGLSYSLLPKLARLKSIRDLLRWESVDLEECFSYTSETIHPFRKISDSEMHKLKVAIGKALDYSYNTLPPLPYRRIQDFYLRQTGYRGLEIIADVEFQAKNRLAVWRCFLATPLSSGLAYVMSTNTESMDKARIEFIVPISNVNKRLVRFLHMYEDLCLVNEELCSLNLVVYGQEDADLVRGYFSSLREIHPEPYLNLIETTGKFSRGRALHFGIRQLRNNPLIFICDVDMIIKKDFLRRCQRNTIKGRQAYYPEFFKYYDMNYVYKLEKKPMGFLRIDRKHGHWATYSFGMACMYKSDYLAAGGFDTSISGWGGEDTALAQALMRSDIDLFRVPDSALLHEFHDKVCSVQLARKQFSDCISSRKESIADKNELARYILHLEEKCPNENWSFWEW